MNQSEELELKLQKVKLAIAEVEEQTFDTFKQRRLKLDALSKIENAIRIKGKELKIDLEAA
tara:strand:+ start:294 stop:476 length:183 start_codon:yes stop_codon:yes gene_type:complete